MAYTDKEKAKAASRRWYEKNKEIQAARAKLRYESNKKEWNLKNGERALQRKYGLSRQDKQQMLHNQNNQCAICEVKMELNRYCHVDHCHKTGKVRKLLCNNCNRGLGGFRDSPSLLNKAVKYLMEAIGE